MKLPKVKLGKSNLYVIKLGFGTLPMGKLQANLSIKEGARIIKFAINQGINLDFPTFYLTKEEKCAILIQKR